MKYLPFEKYIFETSLSPEEVFKRISENIEPERTFRFQMLGNNYNKPYEGKIEGRNFRLKRLISYRNSFLPVLIGTVEPTLNTTYIKFRMRLIHFVLGFMILWMTIIFIVTISMLLMGLSNGFKPPMLIPAVMLAFGYLLTTLAFKYESKKYLAFIVDLLELEEIPEGYKK